MSDITIKVSEWIRVTRVVNGRLYQFTDYAPGREVNTRVFDGEKLLIVPSPVDHLADGDSNFIDPKATT